jgi:hypothetical protein
MIKNVFQTTGKFLLRNSKSLSHLTPLQKGKCKVIINKTNSKYDKNNKKSKINEFNNNKSKNFKKVKDTSNSKDKSISIPIDLNNIKLCYIYDKLHKNKNPSNNKSEKLFLSIINNSSSNLGNSTNETTVNNYPKYQKIISSQITLNNNNRSNNQFSTYSNEINELNDKKQLNEVIIYNNNSNKNILDGINDRKNDLKKYKIQKLILKPKKWKIKKNKKIPDLISSIKKIKKDFIIPLRNEYKIKNAKSIDIKNKILKLKSEILENYKEIEDVQNNKSFINYNSNKNLSILISQKTKSIINDYDIIEIKAHINKLSNEIIGIKKETELFKNDYIRILDEIKEDEKEIKEKKKKINNFLEDKKNVKRMIVLLHRRIIDAKERIAKMNDKKNILDKSWYELSAIYDKSNKNKSQDE